MADKLVHGGMKRSPPYASKLPALEYSLQVRCSIATSAGSGSAQGTPHTAPPRATMNGQLILFGEVQLSLVATFQCIE